MLDDLYCFTEVQKSASNTCSSSHILQKMLLPHHYTELVSSLHKVIHKKIQTLQIIYKTKRIIQQKDKYN